MGPTISFKGLGNDAYYLLAPDRAAVLHGLLGLREHRQREPPDRREVHPRLPRTTGSRRCTSTASASTRARCSTAAATARRWSSRRSSGASSCPRSSRDTKVIAEPWDAGGLYQVGQLPGLALVGVERPLPRRRAPLRARRLRPRRRRSRPASPGSMDMYEGGGRGPANSVNFITATTASRCNDLVALQRASTTRPTARATATASTTTSAGTAASRARPTTRRSTRSARSRSRTSPRSCFLSQGVPMFVAGDEVGRTQQRQQQRLLPGQRAQLVRLGPGREQRRPLPVLQADDRAPPAAPEPSPARDSSPAA